MGVDAILLAAGGSRRLGTPKQLLRIDGETLVRRAVRSVLASGVGELVVVLGDHAREIEAEIDSFPVLKVTHERWGNGLGSSIAAGMRELLERSPETEAVLILLCDQPRVGPAQLSSLVRAFEEGTHPIVAAGYADAAGVPVIFHQSFFGELLTLDGERGARSILQSHRQQLRTVPMPEAAFDIDTREDATSLIHL
jgi:molybdenum cofactor cytidylyltransferase